jgi:hypothetical protein
MSRFESMSHTSYLGILTLWRLTRYWMCTARGESSGCGESRTVSVGDIFCPRESVEEPIVVEPAESVVVSV